MLDAILDTHAAIWYLFGDARLSPVARSFIDNAAAEGDQVALSAITLAEIVYLEEKGRIPSGTLARLGAALDEPDTVLSEVVLDRQVAETLPRIDRQQIPELPDRVIAATALHLGVPVITRDGRIQASDLCTIW
jgi:PIN domain nuclease of toxin-antitoxin system